MISQAEQTRNFINVLEAKIHLSRLLRTELEIVEARNKDFVLELRRQLISTNFSRFHIPELFLNFEAFMGKKY